MRERFLCLLQNVSSVVGVCLHPFSINEVKYMISTSVPLVCPTIAQEGGVGHTIDRYIISGDEVHCA